MVLIVFLIVGGIVGWLAWQYVKGESFGAIGDIATGVIGGLIGGWVFGAIGITSGGLIGAIITAIIGAIILIAGLRAFKRAYPS